MRVFTEYSTTFLAYDGKGQFYSRCLSSDHMQEECALHPNSLVPVVGFKNKARGGRRDEHLNQELRKSWKGPCYAWNDWRCVTPFCRFEHLC